MKKKKSEVKLFAVLIGFLIGALLSPIVIAVQRPQDDEIRRIWDDEFLQKRPRQGRKTKVPNHRYRRVTPTISNSSGASVLGVTVWQLRSSTSGDTRESRDLVHDPATNKNIELTAERIETETPIAEGKYIRISIESPRAGYLYVIDREQYSDGSFGAPTMIFPTRRINKGLNRVVPGMIVQVPAQTDNPPYLTVRPNPNRSDQVAEVLTIIVTRSPLNLQVPSEAIRLTDEQFNPWIEQWSGPVERFELESGASKTRTTAERIAALNRGRRLWQNEAPPQSIYRVGRAGRNTPLLINLKLPLARDGV